MAGIRFYGNTDTGKKRAKNEDNLWPAGSAVPAEHTGSPWGRLFIVADGMGGYGAGNVASQIAVETIRRVYYDEQTPGETPVERLQQAIETAHQEIKAEAKTAKDKARMGTTVVAVVILDNELWGGWVGDSRAYLLRDDQLERLTSDHTVLWDQVQAGQIGWDELHYHPQRSRLNNSLTARREQVTADYIEACPLQDGDRILLCSDGLSSEVRDEEIEQILPAYPPKETTQALINAANRPKLWRRDGEAVHSAGGEDNVTALVIDMPGARSQAAAAGPPLKWVGLVLVAALLIVGVGATAYLLLASGIGTPVTPPETATPVRTGSPAEVAIDLGQSITTPTAGPSATVDLLPSSTPTLAGTDTPQPTSTLAAFDTPTPIPSSTPTPLPTATATFTVTSTETITTPLSATTALSAVVELLEPSAGQVFPEGEGEITFSWRLGSACDLPQGYGFQLRIWQAGEPAVGAMDALAEQDRISCEAGRYSFFVGDLQSAPGVAGARSGQFWWDVLLIDFTSSAQPASDDTDVRTFVLGGSASGGQ